MRNIDNELKTPTKTMASASAGKQGTETTMKASVPNLGQATPATAQSTSLEGTL